MKIKDLKCKCGHNDFFFANKGNQKGIYCSYCGKWLKWADKDEQNLAMKQEPKSEWEKDHEILKAYSDGANEVLDKITAEIEQIASRYSISRERGGMGQVEWSDSLIKESEVLKILDKHKAESENP